ncbi:MAG TPA: HD domain-containing protein [Aggregatilineaceae bacterium]|jgi:hypothetical protein|nr:HD domain-containing protein [Anaerolineae bacterium]HMM28844.1 HD domain-containing protein [Aggregatilineaceae bacterium]
MSDETRNSTGRDAVLALLTRLLVGAERRMDTLGDWVDVLLDDTASPLAQRFVNQLGDEWYDPTPPDAFCEQVAEHVRRHLAGWHPGWPHLWAHVLRVTGVALALAEDEGLPPEEAYLLSLCHDVAKLDELRTSQPHEELGASFAGRVLRGYLPPDRIAAIQAAILKEDDGDALGDILHDADKLDKIGATGVVRRVSTDTRPIWLSSALWRVGDDQARFPPMHFDLSRDLAASKRAFLRWFLPLAEDALDH